MCVTRVVTVGQEARCALGFRGRAAFKSLEGSNLPHRAREGQARTVRGRFFAWTRQKTLTALTGRLSHGALDLTHLGG